MSWGFPLDALNAHNKLRKLHGAPPLVLCETLTKSAKEYAKQLVKIGSLQYSMRPNIGESIACVEGDVIDGESITEIWYSEGANIDWNDLEKSSSYCNNFTQLVWVDSVDFGIGKIVTNDKKVYVVARYSPPGNYRGMYRKNVLPLNSVLSPRSNTQYITRMDIPDQKEIKKTMLSYINRCRDAHAVPHLKWNKKIANDATQIAFRMVSLQGNCDNFDSTEDCYGKIVLCSENGLPPIKTICRNWYDCSLLYNFSNGGYSEATGAFTQLIWKHCKIFGVGIASSGSNYVVVACFEPPGNVSGKYEENVKPLAFDKKNPFSYN